MFIFNRVIDDGFVARLNAEYQRGGWWRAIASDPELFIAIRGGYLNVYWKGASLLELFLNGDKLAGRTHYKYLLRADAPNPYVRVNDGVALLPGASDLFLVDFSDVSALKRAVAPYIGDEKAGVHEIVRSNPNILDVEVAFGIEGNGDASRSTQRIDFAALRPTASGAEIVFYEAKQFSNKEIRAQGETPPPVAGQIQGYGKLIAEHAEALAFSYRKVCGNLASLCGVRERYFNYLDLMCRLAKGEGTIDVSDFVCLVVFGFDSDQRDGKVWAAHRRKLETSLGNRLVLKGDPRDLRLRHAGADRT